MSDPNDTRWPARAWWTAAWGAGWALLVHVTGEWASGDVHPTSVFAFAAGLLGALLMTRRRVRDWLAFTGLAATFLAGVAAATLQYGRQASLGEWPFAVGCLGVALAVPFFATLRDTRAWSLPYPTLHLHAWTEAAIVAASFAFVGLTFLLVILLGQLFVLIDLRGLRELLQQGHFNWPLAGAAFGAAAGVLRERAVLLGTLQRVLMTVLAVLAPLLACGLGAFLLSLPFTGLARLWRATSATTPLMLTSAMSAVLLCNAVIGNGEEAPRQARVISVSAWLLALCLLPLALIAAASLGQRVVQHGWTPDRLWAATVIGIAGGYGIAYAGAVLLGGGAWQSWLRRANVALAGGLLFITCGLALPLVDFGAIATRDQLARFAAGELDERGVDWRAFAFDFGPRGRAALRTIARNGSPEQRALARTALAADNRWSAPDPADAPADSPAITGQLRVLPEGAAADAALRLAIGAAGYCANVTCFAYRVDPDRFLVGQVSGVHLRNAFFVRQGPDEWRREQAERYTDGPTLKVDSTLDLQRVERRELFIDGEPSGIVFE